MRVAVLAHSFPRFPGDTHGPFVKSLCEALAARGHQIFVLVPFDREIRPDPSSRLDVRSFRYVWPDRLHLLGYSRTLRRDVGMKLSAWLESPLYLRYAVRALGRLIARERIDLVHVHWVLPNGYVAWRAARAAGIPYAVTLHGSDVFLAERNFWFRRMARRAVEGAAHVTSCSADLRDRLVRVAGPAEGRKFHLVPNGADIVEVDDSPVERGPARERRVVAIGRLVDKKGFRYLIEAADSILARVPDARLIIGGGGELHGQLERRARSLGLADRVRFTGHLAHDAVLDLVATADVFVMPSVRDAKGNIDGLPVVVLEAMAAGKPVVATAVSGIPLAVDDGETGVLVPEKDPMALADAVVGLLQDPERARALGRAARERVCKDLNWASIARTHDALYRQAVAAHARS